MKHIKILARIIFVTFIMGIIFTLMNNQVSALTISNISHTYSNSVDLFCMDHTKGLGFISYDKNGRKTTQLVYTDEDMSGVIEPSTGYAFYRAKVENDYDAEALQTVVWSSKQWGNSSNVLINGNEYEKNGYAIKEQKYVNNATVQRSYQYGTVYYGIIQNIASDGEIFKTTTNKDDLKVLVDQDEGTYTVGPYKVELNLSKTNEYTNEAKKILYNELVGQNQCFSEKSRFAELTDIENVNGSNIKILDLNGKEIKFPDFVNKDKYEFYLKFKPNDNGDIDSVGTPTLKIKFLNEFYTQLIRHDPIELHFDNYVVSRGDLTGISNVTGATYTENGNTRTYTATATVSTNIKVYSPHNKNTPKYTFKATQGGVKVTGSVTGSWVSTDPEDSSKGYYDFTGKSVSSWSVVSKEVTFKKITINNQVIPGVLDLFQKAITIRVYPYDNGGRWKEVKLKLPEKKIEMVLGGNVWYEIPEEKTYIINGIKDEKDKVYEGMLVQLYDKNNKLIDSKLTDKNGHYKFTGLNPLMKYFVRFTYNGQIYQATYYKNQLTGGYSNAREEGRDDFNKKFVDIYSDPQNYKISSEWRKSYARDQKLEKEDGSFIAYNDGALKYIDAWNKFREYNASESSYSASYKQLESWLDSMGVGSRDKEGVIQFIKDSMITAKTPVKYPVYDQFVLEDLNNPPSKIEKVRLDKSYSFLYTKKSDQSRYVDFGICDRITNDLAIQKDVYKASVIVNGKKQDYIYNKKSANINDDGSWNVEIRAADELYNGMYKYVREIRKSEYLYDGSDAKTTDAKNLQVYVTYRIAVKNQGLVDATINEIVDYYDADKFEFDGELQADGSYKIRDYNEYDTDGKVASTYRNSYIGSDPYGGKEEKAELGVSTRTSFPDRDSSRKISGANYNYSSLYLTGIKSAMGSAKIKPGELAYAYVTFKAKNDPNTGKIMLDQNLENGDYEATIGRRNIAEINGYSTYYSDNTVIPDSLTSNDERIDEKVDGKAAGLIDSDSNPGSLSSKDLDDTGDIIHNKDNKVLNRSEDDTDKAPNIKIVINEKDPRIFEGCVYEDNRTETFAKSVVGNGIDDNETKINGVKVQLIELVQNVDENGIFTGSYAGERVVDTIKYDANGLNAQVVDKDVDYLSGVNGKQKVILSGDGIFNVEAKDIGTGNGKYSFVSVPAGDYIIRFTYGDRDETVLTNDTNSSVNQLLSKTGLNAKSYNGQDYKSTIYQANISQDTKYDAAGITGFKRYDEQNYNIDNVVDKNAMYYYDIALSEKVAGASDAKDIYAFREAANAYSVGANGRTLLNNRAEVLDSFEKLATYNFIDKYEEQLNANQLAEIEALANNPEAVYDKLKEYGLLEPITNEVKQQRAMVDELIANTKMVAQTGLINTEVEKATSVTGNQGNKNDLSYTLDGIDLGLVERAEAGLKLGKQVTNFKLVLANNQVLFDANKGVKNLIFKEEHNGHEVNYSHNGLRLDSARPNVHNTRNTPELIQGYVDDELMEGSKITLTYKLTVENIGEVDYCDKEFYYLGRTGNTSADNISKTNAIKVVDYISNAIKFDKNYQDINASWDLVTAKDLVKSMDENKVFNADRVNEDIVNRSYIDELQTYNALLTTGKLASENGLLPTVAGEGNSTTETTLVVNTILSSSDDLVFNNLAEIVETTNDQGRRMQYSIAGNQIMADQSLGNNAASTAFSRVDLVTPSEIDADSAQKVVIMPPTGEDKDYTGIIIGLIGMALLLGLSLRIIQKKVLGKK